MARDSPFDRDEGVARNGTHTRRSHISLGPSHVTSPRPPARPALWEGSFPYLPLSRAEERGRGAATSQEEGIARAYTQASSRRTHAACRRWHGKGLSRLCVVSPFPSFLDSSHLLSALFILPPLLPRPNQATCDQLPRMLIRSVDLTSPQEKADIERFYDAAICRLSGLGKMRTRPSSCLCCGGRLEQGRGEAQAEGSTKRRQCTFPLSQ